MEGRRAWVEELLGACDRALARLEERDDADLELVADLEQLRARLRTNCGIVSRASAAESDFRPLASPAATDVDTRGDLRRVRD